MGAPMATKMTEWPGGITVYDIRTEAMTPLAEKGASWPTASPTLPSPTSSTSPCSTMRRCVRSSASWRHTPSPARSSRSTRPSATPPLSNWPANSKQQGHSHRRRSGQRRRGCRRERRAGDDGGRRPRGVRADQAGVQTLGVGGHPRRRAGRGHPNEVGPQHVDVHLVRRGVRGHETCRGRRAGSAGSGPGGAPHRRPHRRPRRDHGPRRHERP